MSALSAREMRAVTDLAGKLYTFLPGTPHPRADARISFPGAAASVGLGAFWSGSSKRPAIAQLLRLTLEQRRGSFCSLISAIVTSALIYRQNKDPLTRREVEDVNALIQVLQFKIPELWDEEFLRTLSTTAPAAPPTPASPTTPDAATLAALRADFLGLAALAPQPRGFAFERTLNTLFHAFGLAPRSSFRLVGEQIDGSFDLHNATYLVEAKYTGPPIGAGELIAFAGKVSAKARWSRGAFISYSGYSADGLEAFSRGRATDIVCIDGEDLYHVLAGAIDFRELLERKARRAVETGRAFIPARELFTNIT